MTRTDLRLIGFLVIGLLCGGVGAGACEPAQVQFEGTTLTRGALQIENDKIYFFRGTKQEVALNYSPSRKKWCYAAMAAEGSRPAEGCMDRKMSNGQRLFLIEGQAAKNFILRDEQKKPVAAISVIGKVMTANFLGADGKILGKRLVFKSVTRDYFETLEVRGWNCPNPRYLSCVGADLTSVMESESAAATMAARLPVADLGKRLGHYRFSCAGIIEHALDGSGETKRAPSFSEP